MDKIWGIALGIYALLLWIIVLTVWRKGYREWKENQANRLCEYDAKVVDKRSLRAGEECYVMFEYRNRQVEHPVSKAMHDSVRVGQEGTLRIRGGAFEDFIPRPETDRADDIYRRMVRG